MRTSRRRHAAPPSSAVYRAAAALPAGDRASAVDMLRDQLRIMARAAGATPDWSTLAVAGPKTIGAAGDRSLVEWAASVAVPGTVPWDQLPEPEVIVLGQRDADATLPFGRPVPLKVA